MSDPTKDRLSREAKAKPAATPVTAAQVVAYLRRHSDFLARHPELLDMQLSPRRHQGDGIVDLQQFMMDRLKADVTRLRADQDDFVANSRDNLNTIEHIHNAVIELLEAESFEHYIEIVTSDLAFLLEVDAVSLCVELTDITTRRPRHDGIRFFDPGDVDRIMGKGRKVWLRDEIEGDPEIFGGVADLIRSDALLRLNISSVAPAGLIAFGTRHPGYFHAGQGTELMSFLGRIIELGIRSWLALPKP